MMPLHDWRSAAHKLSLHNLCMPNKDPIAKESGVRIRAARDRHGWSQEELARRTGWVDDKPDQAQPNALSPSRIGNFEQGTRRIRHEQARILERVLRQPAAYFMGLISEHEARVIEALRHPPGDSGGGPPALRVPDPSY